MGHFGKERIKNQETNWSRKNTKTTPFNCRRQKVQKILQKAKKAPLNSTDLCILLGKQAHFLGVFASDQLETLKIVKNGLFFIVNLDTLSQPGSHWLAIRIGRKSIEVFDSLGFNFNLWEKYPTHLLNFLSRYSRSHNFFVWPVLQPPNTYTCGLFCAFYIISRQKISFTKCVGKFSRDLHHNNQKLYRYLDKLCLKYFQFFI